MISEAIAIAHDLLVSAKDSVDSVMGAGAAKKNPELVAAVVNTASRVLATREAIEANNRVPITEAQLRRAAAIFKGMQ